MASCVVCGLTLIGRRAAPDDDVCAHHAASYQDNWAVHNRVLCDFIHRRVEPSRLTKEDRDEFWSYC